MDLMKTKKYLSDMKYLKKKIDYAKISKDLKSVLDAIQSGNSNSKAIAGLGKEYGGKVFKVRVPNSTAKKGKSNGFRLIYYLVTEQNTIYLITIYSKKDANKNPTNEQLKTWIEIGVNGNEDI